jgi:hypothetical protein
VALAEREVLAALMVGIDPPDFLELFSARPAWMAAAACRGGDTASWFPTVGESGVDAKAVCAACPAQVECLDYALAPIVHEMTGGLTASISVGAEDGIPAIL